MSASTHGRNLRLRTARPMRVAALLSAGLLATLPAQGADSAATARAPTGATTAVTAVAAAGHATLPGAPADGWARYEVPMVAGSGGPCCHEINRGSVVLRECNLDRRGGVQINTSADEDAADAGAAAPAADALAVYLHFDAGSIDRVRAFAAGCPVRAERTPVALSVDADASIRLLAGLAGDNGKRSDEAVMALAHHAGPRATAALIDLVDGDHAEDVREQAVFWLGQLRGQAGVDTLERVIRSDTDDDVREHAVFSLSQSDHGGDAALIRIVRGDYPRELKKTALFWLGQSGSDEAIAFLDSVLAAD